MLFDKINKMDSFSLYEISSIIEQNYKILLHKVILNNCSIIFFVKSNFSFVLRLSAFIEDLEI
jgi:hypothetical protein